MWYLPLFWRKLNRNLRDRLAKSTLILCQTFPEYSSISVGHLFLSSRALSPNKLMPWKRPEWMMFSVPFNLLVRLTTQFKTRIWYEVRHCRVVTRLKSRHGINALPHYLEWWSRLDLGEGASPKLDREHLKPRGSRDPCTIRYIVQQ